MSMSVDEVIEDQITASVMIIDDQSASRKILKETIKNINPGISVKVFKSASAALAAAETATPDLIIQVL